MSILSSVRKVNLPNFSRGLIDMNLNINVIDVLLTLYRYNTSRQQPQSSVITGADYNDVLRDDNRRDGNRRANTNRRYNNDTVNYYDYENVEEDRKKFVRKSRRNEGEQVDTDRLVLTLLL